ncbi:MAG: hypothetical protein ABIT83_17630 [Massilia sp.]
MFHLSHHRGTARLLFQLCLATACVGGMSNAQAARHRPAGAVDLTADLRALAGQRPWRCDTGVEASSDAPTLQGWRAEASACAWKNLLRMRRWTGPGTAAPNACLTPLAHWWTWARRGQDAPRAWRQDWISQSIVDARGAEQGLVILRRLADAQWSVTEWRWTPSARAATRRWQEGRWQLLLAEAARLRQPAAAQDAGSLPALLDANLGERPGEAGATSFRWPVAGHCLAADSAAPGPQQLHLSYAADDSRLEQRAALQLQLARRYPRATWLTPFSLVPPAPRSKGARFYAVWLDGATLSGQLWMPTRGDGPLVRLRIDTVLASPAAASAAATAKQALEPELMALANAWSRHHE